jgi:hypothetical protein
LIAIIGRSPYSAGVVASTDLAMLSGIGFGFSNRLTKNIITKCRK